MSVQKAIDLIGREATAADNPIEYLEKKACKEYFAKLTKALKKYHPDLPAWTRSGINPVYFTDYTVTFINGSVIAIVPKH